MFLDRDGTLIGERWEPDYLADPEGIVLVPGTAETLIRFRDAGYALIVVTNQARIGRGPSGWEEYDALSRRLDALLADAGAVLDGDVACGHAPELGQSCDWRKPEPGMILAAANTLDLDLGRSIFVGDKLSDMEAAAKAGVGTGAHVLTGHGQRERPLVTSWEGPKPRRLLLLDSIADLSP
ncbi:MAG: HAD family hydrolase [Bauldia sp.]|nr:HAD family hydrolase [Bauldia sp.]